MGTMKKPSKKIALKEVTCQVQYVGKSSANSNEPFHTTFGLEVNADASDEQIADAIFSGFNNGSGREWNLFRFAHIRSMSVGDMVAVDGRWYECYCIGWKKVDVLKAVSASV